MQPPPASAVSLLSRCIGVLARFGRQPRAQGLMDGLIAGTAVQVVLAQYLTVLGASDAVVVASVFVCGACAAGGAGLRRRVCGSPLGIGLPWMLFAGWLAVSPLLLSLAQES